MKLLHLAIIVILVSGLVVYNNTYADNKTTSHGGLVSSHKNMTTVLPSPPLDMYPYTSKIFSVFQVDPEIVHPNDTSSIHILVTNNANFTLYDVNLGESVNDSKSMLFSNIHKIDILNPNQTKTIYGTLHVSAGVQPTNYYDIWWNVAAKNETGSMMESMQFHRNLPIIQNMPQYYSGPVVITLESPLEQFKSGIKPGDVQCNTGFELIFKSDDGSPACVRPSHVSRLVQQGWYPVTSIHHMGMTNDTSHNNNSGFSMQTSVNGTTYRDVPHHTGYPIVGDTQGIVVNSDAEASRLTGFDVHSPIYLPQGYKVQLIKASKEIPTVTIFASKFPLTDKTTSHDFLWDQKGILITFDRVNPRELRNYDQIWAGANKIDINGTRAVVTYISTGYQDGYQYDMWGSVIAMEDNTTNIAIRGFFHPNDLIRMTASMLEK